MHKYVIKYHIQTYAMLRYAPVSKDRGQIVFRLSVCLSAKTLTLALSFEYK
jgi:hypothetical protein